MRKRTLAALSILIALKSSGCGGPAAATGDSLVFGTSFAGFTLLGQASSFSLAATNGNIAFRLDSSVPFGNRFIRLYIESTGGSGSAPYAQEDYTAGITPQGQILLSTFRITDPGNYKVRAVLVETILDIGSETPITEAYLYMQN